MKQPTEILSRWAMMAAVAAMIAGAAGPVMAARADGEVQLSPYRTEPGATVKIIVFECEGPAFAESEGFVEDVALEDDDLGTMVGWARIDDDALGGSYGIEVDCQGGGGRRFGTFHVLGEYGFGGYGPETGGGGLASADAAGEAGAAGRGSAVSGATAGSGAVTGGEGADRSGATAGSGAVIGSGAVAGRGSAAGGAGARTGSEAAGGPERVPTALLGWGAGATAALVAVGGLVLAVRRRAAGRG
ncbi:hypothetical protein GCM10010517_69830 [Streptosporangium fragile]|uniref:Gram-positive cocci surface proteins LPxTG domain-containing protein n=1 Tax=Streptosporangium fragile TaxID=46186 RepID=A0ABN3W899_9ACTN